MTFNDLGKAEQMIRRDIDVLKQRRTDCEAQRIQMAKNVADLDAAIAEWESVLSESVESK